MKSLFLGFGCLTLLAASGCGGDDDSVFSSTGGSANAGKGGSSVAGSTSSGGSAGKASGSGGKGGSAGKGSGGDSGKGGSPSSGSGGCADDCCGDECGSGGTTGGTTGGADSGGAGTGGSSGGSGAAGAGDAGAGGAMVGSAPAATINHPGDGEVRDAGDDIPFVGVGTDAEDGALSGSSLVWTSSLTGQFGTGALFDAALNAGTHVVTLTVTDSDGNTGTDSVTLEIQ